MELVQTNRRRSPRFSASHKIEAQLNVNGCLYEGTVTDYAVMGLGLQVSEEAQEAVEKFRSEVKVTMRDLALIGTVRHVKTHEAGALLGLSLKVPWGESEVSFTSDDPGWDLIENKETIDQIFQDLAFKGPEIQISVRQIQGQAIVLPEKLLENRKLLAEIFEAKKGKLTEGSASLQFELFQTCHAFEVKIRPIENNRVEIDLPTALARLLRRETYRIKNGTNGRFLKIRMESETLGKPSQELKVYDFCEHGISVIDSTGWLCAPIGTKIESIEVTTNDAKVIRGRGEVRGFQWLQKEGAYSVGVRFETASDTDRTEWHNTILAARYPSLSFSYESTDHQGVWDLFDRSGYLDIQDRNAFSHVFDITKKTWERLSSAGTAISKRVMIRMEGSIVGHLQMDRIYPGTWCVHHLAIDPKISKVVGKELYSVTTDVLSAEGARYVLSITEAAKPWNQRNYYDFVKTYRFQEHNELKNYQLFEVAVAQPRKLRIDPALVLRPANRYDEQPICRYFELFGTALEREACGLTREDLKLDRLNEEFAPHGLFRSRQFVVATSSNRIVGFARVERGTYGVNIFGLQDTLYVHVLPECGSDGPNVYESLVEAGLRLFSDLGHHTAIVLLDDGRTSYYTERGLPFIFDGIRWIGKCVAARRYHAYTQMLYGHLLLHRENLRRHRKENAVK